MLRFHLYSFLFSALQPALLLQVKKRSGMTRAMNKGLWISSSPNFPNQAMSHFSLTSARQKNCFCFLFHLWIFLYFMQVRTGRSSDWITVLARQRDSVKSAYLFVSTWFILFGCVFFFLVFFFIIEFFGASKWAAVLLCSTVCDGFQLSKELITWLTWSGV